MEERTRALSEANCALQVQLENRERLEAELRQAQKLEAIGHLAGGVAHDFNNILMVIQGYTDMLLAEATGDGTARSDLDHIQQAARRGSDLTRQLLAFGRKQVLTIGPLDLNAVLADTSHMLSRLIGEGVSLELAVGQAPCPIEADRVQLEQVLINLAVNARDAMSGRGTLRISVEPVTIERPTANLGSGRYVRLTVRDTGCGMDRATQERIFEPFFTTKAPGQGSGLGLSTVHGVVKQLGGRIDVESTPLQGTCFSVHFPETSKPLVAIRDTAGSPPRRPRLETVLVVEDDPAVRTVLDSMLTRHGYTVLQAGGPKQALALARTHQGTIDLVLSDVVMPEMSGPEMVTLLSAARPETRAVYLSGYAAEWLTREGILPPGPRVVTKPIAARDLLDAVRRALDGDRATAPVRTDSPV